MKHSLFCLFLSLVLVMNLLPCASLAVDDELITQSTLVSEFDDPDPSFAVEENLTVIPEEEIIDNASDDASAEVYEIPSDNIPAADESPEITEAEYAIEDYDEMFIADYSDETGEDTTEYFVAPIDDIAVPDAFLPDNEALLDTYISSLFSCSSSYESSEFHVSNPALYSSDVAGSYLDGQNAQLYHTLKNHIISLASGNSCESLLTLSVSEFLGKKTFTAAELGVDKITADNAASLYYTVFTFNLNTVLNALLADCPYEFYWYEKTAGTAYKLPVFSYTSSRITFYDTVTDSSGNTADNTLAFYFTVTDSCTAGKSYAYTSSVGKDIFIYTLNSEEIRNAITAAANAEEIVATARNFSDYEKLRYYNAQICSLVSYDSDAAAGRVPYGDAWQLVYVFDHNPATNVVCEGYAKAFQFLCERTSFSSPAIRCILVTGTLNDGGHMWNVVRMNDGKNYLVDVTNCDNRANTERLFLQHATSGSPHSGYILNSDNIAFTYRYDADTLGTFSETDLILSSGNYHAYTTIVHAPTCTDQGYTEYTCTCGERYSDDFVPALGHDFQFSESVPPVGNTAGYSIYVCTRCKESRQQGFVYSITSITVNMPVPAVNSSLPDSIQTNGGNCGVSSIQWEDSSGTPYSGPAVCGQEYSVSISVTTDSGYIFPLSGPILCTISYDNSNSEVITAAPTDEKSLSFSLHFDFPHNLQHVSAREATFAGAGNIEHYFCSICNKYYRDVVAQQELSESQVIIPAKVMIAPALQSAACDSNGIILRWIESASCASYTNSYSIYRKVSGGTWSKIAVADAASVTQGYDESGQAVCSYIDTAALNSGTTYVYTVRASGEGVNSSYNRSGISTVYLSAPTLNSVSNSASGIVIRWSSVTSASRYAVYRKTAAEDNWTLLSDSIAGTSYTDTSTGSNIIYTYTVRAYASSWGCYDDAGCSILCLRTPSLSKIINSGTTVRISWNSVSGADQYYIYRKPQGGSWKLLGVTMETVYSDSSTVSGSTYTYTVRARNSEQEVLSSYNSGGLTIKCLYQPALTSVSCSGGGLTMKWTSISGASQYRLYRKTDSTGWSRIASLSNTSYTDTSISTGIRYSYTVIAADGSSTSSYDSSGISGVCLATPTVTTAIENTASRIHIKWNSISDADTYILYRKSGSGSWSRIADGLTATEYYDTNLISGISYSYTVRAFSNTYNSLSGYKSDTAAILYLASPTMSVSGSGSVTVAWQKVTGATSYALYRRSGSSSWSRIASVTSLSYKDTSVTPGVYYYYTVRAINGNTLGCYDKTGIKAILPATVSPAAATATKEGIHLSWTGVAGGDTYQVWRRTGSSGWTKIATVSQTEYTDTDITAGTSYTYTIRAFNIASNCLGGYHKTGVTIKS